MDEFLNQLSYWLSQAYVYIPAILTAISSIGFPAIVQIAKIFASAKLYLQQVSVLLKKLNECVVQVQGICELVTAWTENDIAFHEELAKTTINKKQRLVIENHVNSLKQRKGLVSNMKIKALEKSELEPKKVKIKVKVKKGN
jgi:hypothetical protein